MRRGIGGLAEYAATVAVIVGVWWLYATYFHVPAYLLPAPGPVWRAIVQLFASGRIWPNLGHTVAIMAGGFLCGSLLGAAIGVVLGRSPRVEALFGPYVFFLQTAPKIALAPLFVLWFGLGWFAQFVLVVSLVFFPVTVGAATGIRSINPNLRDLGAVLRASPWTMIRMVELPASLPFIFSGLRVAVVQAVIGVIVAEWMSGKTGLGYLMVYGSTTYDSPLLLAAIVLTIAMGIASYQLVGWAERRSLGWHESAQAEPR